jgi:uncharacterized protein YlzI (FlbEa/FlbD family)
MGRSDKIKADIISDFSRTKPKVIFLDKNFSVLGSNPQDYAPFFTAYVRGHYLTLLGYKNNEYITTVPISTDVDLEAKMYINKDNVDEVINKLLSAGLIKKTFK